MQREAGGEREVGKQALMSSGGRYLGEIGKNAQNSLNLQWRNK